MPMSEDRPGEMFKVQLPDQPTYAVTVFEDGEALCACSWTGPRNTTARCDHVRAWQLWSQEPLVEPQSAPDVVVENLLARRYSDGEVGFFIDGTYAGATRNFGDGFDFSELGVLLLLRTAALGEPLPALGSMGGTGLVISPQVDGWARDHRDLIDRRFGEVARGEKPAGDANPGRS
jgi:hypothetical protein